MQTLSLGQLKTFCALCTGERGISKSKSLALQGIYFLQSDSSDGTSGKSIYGAKFADENFIWKPTGPKMSA
ncbi:hypothetical protein O6H91_Y268100 [Diphasiastrum complanatum]|nr:hypothetical protein O6H91_Y268100 [Diphasiastrum complanatum]